MRYFLPACALVVSFCISLAGAVAPLSAATERDRELCLRLRGDKSPFDRRVKSCSAVIKSARREMRQSSAALDELIEGLLSRCHAYRYQQRYSLAERDCGEAFKAFETGARTWGNSINSYLIKLHASRGALHSAMGHLDKALNDENEAINSLTSADMIYAYLFTNRGLTYSSLKQFDAALNDYDQAITLDDRFMPAYVERGIELMRRGQTARARADLQRALSLGAGDYDLGHESHARARQALARMGGR